MFRESRKRKRHFGGTVCIESRGSLAGKQHQVQAGTYDQPAQRSIAGDTSSGERLSLPDLLSRWSTDALSNNASSHEIYLLLVQEIVARSTTSSFSFLFFFTSLKFFYPMRAGILKQLEVEIQSAL